jgi:hypothetical protein
MALSGMLGAGCGRDGGVSDSELGDLVLAPKAADHAIDVAAAAKDPRELGRALAVPHSRLGGLLGPHRLAISSSFEVTEAGVVVEQQSDETTLDFASPASWRGVANNSADYGREVIFEGGALYLRARYQRYHQRPPTTEAEPAALRDRFADAATATWELLAPAAAVADLGAVTFPGLGGKPARKIAISMAAAPRKPEPELLAQRKWREQRSLAGVEGEAVLDAASGAPLSLTLRGTVGFTREGKSYSMKVSLKSEVSSLAQARAISAPDPAEVVLTPTRLHEVDERDKLLERIAPPLRSKQPSSSPPPPPSPPAAK